MQTSRPGFCYPVRLISLIALNILGLSRFSNFYKKAKRDAEVSQRSGVHTRSERVLRTSPRRKLTEAETELAASALADIMRRRKSGVHTRFPEDGVDQTSVLPVSVNADS